MERRLLPVLLLAALCVLAGCSGTGFYQINASITRVDDSILYHVTYSEGIKEISSGGVSGAEIDVTGPMGTTRLAETSSGTYEFFSSAAGAAAHYVPGANYTVTASYGGNTDSATIAAPGGITYAADGSSVSWLYNGNSDTIRVTKPDGSHVDLPENGANTVDFNAAGVYNAGPGQYTLYTGLMNTSYGCFGGATGESSIIAAHEAYKIVYK